jgi:hypothetical protein
MVGRPRPNGCPDFELLVTRHKGGGDIQVECKRGCNLGYGNATAVPAGKNVGFACKTEVRCDFPLTGWVQR